MTDGLENLEQEPIVPQEPEGEPENDMLHKATVSKIVARERLKAFEKGKQEALMELQQQQQNTMQQEQPQPTQAPAQQQAQSLGGMQQMSQADIERMINERAPQLLQQQLEQKAAEFKSQQLINDFVTKMQAAEEQYPGLEKELNELEYDKPGMMELIQLANSVENTGAVMKEMLDHPMKMGGILNLIHSQPRKAVQEMAKLSNSIKQNQDALKEDAQARDPLSQLRPSQNIGQDTSSMSVNDFRKMFR